MKNNDLFFRSNKNSPDGQDRKDGAFKIFSKGQDGGNGGDGGSSISGKIRLNFPTKKYLKLKG
ncbi:hypothetical protein [Fluviispira sanaruensis]|uniref:Uncharacterized protein n=1 Tax=Fluviispira sanaruensis TaxID=2493639 RepID=A0A4P2VM03_FLUSA|nr:hypothetical protein [Fluviispira sanaruensis]BBH53748.1 hypothetical protein JCM31447_21960 [Fluviispira sanaruensis]